MTFLSAIHPVNAIALLALSSISAAWIIDGIHQGRNRRRYKRQNVELAQAIIRAHIRERETK